MLHIKQYISHHNIALTYHNLIMKTQVQNISVEKEMKNISTSNIIIIIIIINHLDQYV